MPATKALTPASHRQILALAWPIILANVAVPLLGIADTAVIGNVGTVAELGAIALGSLVFSFIYWGLGFLRMSTTGFVARAEGAEDALEVRVTVLRAGLLAVGLGSLLLLLQRPVEWLALWLLGGSDEIEATVALYMRIRIWGAPASLATAVVIGTLVGLRETRRLLVIQVFLNALNIALDVALAKGLGMGVRGIALGTVIAEWAALALSLWLLFGLLRARHRDAGPLLPFGRVLAGRGWASTFAANLDIMVRTLLMLLCFGWFTNQGARFGDEVVAGNHILLQFISFSAFFLDGFAHAAEPLVGEAVGARRRDVLDSAMRRSSELAGVVALVLGLGVLLAGRPIIALMTDLALVRESATRFLPHAALYVSLSFAAFQLDGIFIGATRTRAMRDAALQSSAVFFVAFWLLAPRAGNAGLWAAFVIYVVARALALLRQLPALRRSAEPVQAASSRESRSASG